MDEPIKVIIVLIAAVAAGFINAISAAGSLVSLSAFMFAGLTATQANASNRVSVLAQNLASMAGYKSKGIKTEPYMGWLALATMPGAVIGALFALKISENVFSKVLLLTIVLFLIITIVNPLKYISNGKPLLTAQNRWIGLIVHFFIGIYGGFIQAGAGFFLMAASMLLNGFDIIKTNHYKAVIMFTYTMVAFLIFFFKGDIHWFYAVVMSIGMSVGGFIGSRWSIGANEKITKVAIVIILVTFMIYLAAFRIVW